MKLENAYFAILLTALCGLSAIAQDGTRSITSDDFVVKRPAAKAAPKKQARKAVYKLSGNQSAVRRKGPAVRKGKSAAKTGFADIGVTVWKLRQTSAAASVTFPVSVSGRIEQWSAERVGADTKFRSGDRVRFAVEPSTAGYLYVIDSEILGEESYGDPYLIFPNGNEGNRVLPGMLVDIPDQKEDLPYFNISPKANGYRGELLTVIVSPVPIPFATDREGKITNIERLLDLEVDADFSVFERTDDDDKEYTREEAASACGAKARTLVREKSNAQRPCGEQTRQLTRDEPPPQTVYRVKTATGSPAVAFVRLNVSD